MSRKDEKLAWAHGVIAEKLEELAVLFPKLPRHTCILRDPDRPERHIVITNEPDEIAEALENVVRVSKPEGAAHG